MTDIGYGAVMFVCGVVLATLYFIRSNKSDRANRDAVLEKVHEHSADLRNLKNMIDGINAWLDIMKRENSAIRNVQLADRVNALEASQAKYERILSKTQLRVTSLVMRLLVTFKPEQPKAKQQREVTQ
jgi:hypothetical protein